MSHQIAYCYQNPFCYFRIKPRLDGNVMKELDQANMYALTFTFQEAVERMAGR